MDISVLNENYEKNSIKGDTKEELALRDAEMGELKQKVDEFNRRLVPILVFLVLPFQNSYLFIRSRSFMEFNVKFSDKLEIK